MKRNEILVFGYFGHKSGKLDGQTVKTRACEALLREKLDEKTTLLRTFDTESLHSQPWRIIKWLCLVLRTDKVVYLPAHNNLRFFFPVLYFLSRLFRFEIIYILIGGWLPELIKDKPFFIKKLGRIKAVLAEGKTVADTLTQRYQWNNVQVMYNFRLQREENITTSTHNTGDVFRLVFMSRITRKKGIDVVFAVAEKFQNKNTLKIDFYGPVFEEDKNHFHAQIKRYENVQYKGVLEPQNIVQTLSEYDALILPTRYATEGCPGAVIDAYRAGLPVLVSAWNSAGDYVDHKKTGYIVPMDEQETETYVRYIDNWISNKESHRNMKEAALAKAQFFTAEAAWMVLDPFLSAGGRK